MRYRANLKLSEIEGAWEGECPTPLVERCKASWETPLAELSDRMVATYLRQKLGKQFMLIEAKRRLDEGTQDDTQLYDGELFEAYENAKNI